ncbi:hypothetical protein [Mycolicibacterium sp.]|uniref:hypothetical protein n=1 Tax=Mycolicibacterium sp. TaxID=2320850 RepID=UPI0037CC2E69
MAIERDSEWVPPSCSLPAADQPLRVAEFDQLFAESVARSARASSTRLDLVLDPDAETWARTLAARESECCSFFRFGFRSAGADLVMRIEVPPTRVTVLDSLAARVAALSPRSAE